MLALMALVASLSWISPGMREHEEEFRQEWLLRFGSTPSSGVGAVPPAVYKAWYKQFKKTGMRPREWLATLSQGPPGGAAV